MLLRLYQSRHNISIMSHWSLRGLLRNYSFE